MTTCPRKGSLLRFKLNSPVTSDGSEQKLGNNVWHDSELIAAKSIANEMLCLKAM